MPKFEVELWMDGYESEEEMEDACAEFIYEQLNFSASSVKIKMIDNNPVEPTTCKWCGKPRGYWAERRTVHCEHK